MKIGSTYTVKVKLDTDISLIDSIIFTLVNQSVLTKRFPEEVVYEEGRFQIGLTQEETIELGAGNVQIEAQLNYISKAVSKTTVDGFNIIGSLGTEIIEGNTPNGKDDAIVELNIDGTVVYARSGGGGNAMWGDIIGTITNQRDLMNMFGTKASLDAIPKKTSQLVNDSDFLTEHQPIKTINNQSLIGIGNITIGGGSGLTPTDVENIIYEHIDDIADAVIDRIPSAESEAF